MRSRILSSGFGMPQNDRIDIIVSTERGPPSAELIRLSCSAPYGMMRSVPASSVNPALFAATRISLCILVLGSKATYFVTFAGLRYCAACPWPVPARKMNLESLLRKRGLTCTNIKDNTVGIWVYKCGFEITDTFVCVFAKFHPNVGHKLS